jgi:hypothetical protein
MKIVIAVLPVSFKPYSWARFHRIRSDPSAKRLGKGSISGGQSVGSHFLAIRPVLLEVSQQVADLLLILEAGVGHLGAGNFGLGILDVLTKRRLVPSQTRVLVGIRISISRIRTGLSANEAIQNGTDSVLRGFADLMTGFAYDKGGRQKSKVLRILYKIGVRSGNC